MAGMSDISREKNQLHPPPSAGSKKGRDKGRKTKDVRPSVHVGGTADCNVVKKTLQSKRTSDSLQPKT